MSVKGRRGGRFAAERAKGGADDELVEVTPKAIRLRKRLLDPNDRKRASRTAAAEEFQPTAVRREQPFIGSLGNLKPAV